MLRCDFLEGSARVRGVARVEDGGGRIWAGDVWGIFNFGFWPKIYPGELLYDDPARQSSMRRAAVLCAIRTWKNTGTCASIAEGLGLFWGHFLLLFARTPLFVIFVLETA